MNKKLRLILTGLGWLLVGLVPAILVQFFVGGSAPKPETEFLEGTPEALISERVLYSEEVTLKVTAFTNYVLMDGRCVQVQLWEEFHPDIFKEGQKLILYYSTAQGMRIMDPVTHNYRQVSVIRDKQDQPFHIIDILFQKSAEVNFATCNQSIPFWETLPLWQCEIRRMENLLLNAKNTPPEMHERILKMRKFRTAYLDQLYRLTSEAVGYGLTHGTGHQEAMDYKEYNYCAYRDFALQLCMMGQYLNNYNYPGWEEQRRMLDELEKAEAAKGKKN